MAKIVTPADCAQVIRVLATALLLMLPYFVAPFTLTLLTEALILAIWAMSLDVLVGFTGLVAFGHAAPFGLASYAAGYFAREVSPDFFATLVVAEIVVVAVAAATGFVATRASGVAFAIISLAIAQVLFQIAVAWRPVTEGMDGLANVPLPRAFGTSFGEGRAFYVLTVAAFVGAYAALRRLVDSPFGHTLHAIRTNEGRAAAIGINPRLHKWLAFVISWAIAGLAGTLLVFMKAGTTPMALHWTESGNVLAMTIFGGIGTLFGPAIGAITFDVLRDEFTSRFQAWQFVFGLVFILVVLAFPSGIAGIVNVAWKSLWRSRS
ncbi:MAG TPA: branched-chain amino acid ABC transporter permease [Xanthobacteraceae bacterium]|nr:branched-chain amino acid ABC transporter permease [Xanthobacteraceae bacterium]